MNKELMLKLRLWAKSVKVDIYAIWLAGRDPRTPFLVKIFAMIIAAYAVSPIDLIPDFIPVLGYLDDIIIIPLGIILIIKLIPTDVMEEHRENAKKMIARPVSKVAPAIFIVIWITCIVFFINLLWPIIQKSYR
ncbi:DUF1232 domain-containing protein [Aeromonas hydrophila]|uniref:YkvA family protein n=1 Tax=Aeromonas hydrophila TaxID=644 RepID=UPI00249ED794|nr:DUF1232 domain-containing protein [Aeromonas hydrophila]WGY30800.1 DUF1232 domain-containing protein [Aeromonas hydrophila]HDC4321951.1 DUF1232 domain-containing protein [Aeromonas hydrophila]